MESEVFLRHDVENILKAINAANVGIAQHVTDASAVVYRAGFTDVLIAVATALHIDLDVEPSGGDMVEDRLRLTKARGGA